jgi:putative DNA-invertase from lambdoid prophage Rac
VSTAIPSLLWAISKFAKERPRIDELMRLGLSARKIAKVLGYSNHIGLNTYISKRKLQESLR